MLAQNRTAQAVAAVFAIWLYSRKKKPGQTFFQVVDRIVILVALTGALIRLGNFFNSEIIGLPTEAAVGVVFANPLTEALESEVMIARIACDPVNRGEVGDTAGLFGAKMIDLAPNSITFEVSGTPDHLASFLDHMRSYGIIDLVKRAGGRVEIEIYPAMSLGGRPPEKPEPRCRCHPHLRNEWTALLSSRETRRVPSLHRQNILRFSRGGSGSHSPPPAANAG